MAERTQKVTLRIPERFLKAIDVLVELDDFPSRSEAIRTALRDLVYARLDLVTEKMKKMQDAERSLAAMQSFRKEYMQK